MDTALGLVELDAGGFKPQTAEFQDAPHVSFEIIREVFVMDSEHHSRKHGVPVAHKVEISALIASEMIDAVGKLLPGGK